MMALKLFGTIFIVYIDWFVFLLILFRENLRKTIDIVRLYFLFSFVNLSFVYMSNWTIFNFFSKKKTKNETKQKQRES